MLTWLIYAALCLQQVAALTVSCNFEDSQLVWSGVGFSINCPNFNGGGVWYATDSGTGTRGTGPDTATVDDQYYGFMEANQVSSNSAGVLTYTFPATQVVTTLETSFDYFALGAGIVRLDIVYYDNNGVALKTYSITGPQQVNTDSAWSARTYKDENINWLVKTIEFRGEKGTENTADYALDNILIKVNEDNACNPACGANAECVNAACSCLAGYTGNAFIGCTPVCSTPCTGNSVCSAPNTCTCLSGYGGSNCDPICSPVTCHQNGFCSSPNNCDCKSGYSGDGVSTCAPICNNLVCGANSQCVAPNFCQCNTGYTGSNGVCSPVCTFPVCDANAQCVSPNQCVCNQGYTGNGQTCTAICSDTCHTNGQCNAQGRCECRSGYFGDGVTSCTSVCTTPCSMNGLCSGPNQCTCKTGYQGDGYSCSSICTGCSVDSICISPGNCICKTGYEGNGISCTLKCPATCGEHASCVNGQCVCESGFSGDGFICKDGCSNGCHVNAACIENRCKCNHGYDGDGVVSCIGSPYFSQWSEWSACEGTICGQVERKKTRVCIARCNGVTAAQLEITEKCSLAPCITYQLSQWTGFTDCSKTCGVGSRVRMRTCQPYAVGACDSFLTSDIESCNYQPCKDYELENYSSWSECSSECQTLTHPSTQVATRSCTCEYGCTKCDASVTTFLRQNCNVPFCGETCQAQMASYIMLVDTSHSVTEEDWTALKVSLKRFVSELGFVNKNYALINFGGSAQIEMTCGQYNTQEAFDQKLDSIARITGGTSINSGLGKANQLFQSSQCSGKKVLMMIVDGVENKLLYSDPTDKQIIDQTEALTRSLTDYIYIPYVMGGTVSSNQPRPDQLGRLITSDADGRLEEFATHQMFMEDTEVANKAVAGLCGEAPKWSGWTLYSQCSVSCGGSGFQERTRTCRDQFGAVSKECQGDSVDVIRCEPGACSYYPAWGGWNTCDDTCYRGNGVSPRQTRSRTCVSSGFASNPCIGASFESRDCNQNSPCVGSWSGFTSWSTCPFHCTLEQQLFQARTRTCQLSTLGGGCPGGDAAATETQACNTQLCNGQWGAWEDWGECSAFCYDGITKPTQKAERCCEFFNEQVTVGDRCNGDSYSKTQECNMNQDCPGTWDTWGAWQDCPATCHLDPNNAPTQTRTRQCLGPNACLGSNTDSQNCKQFVPCPGEWSGWSPFGECSATCHMDEFNPPKKTATRFCVDSSFGATCPGSDTMEEDCKVEISCPGRLTKWTEWTGCPGTCQTVPMSFEGRTRECLDTSFLGNCEGAELSETDPCHEGIACQGTWLPWQPSTQCSSTCRTRELIDAGQYPTTERIRVCAGTTLDGNCNGEADKETEFCNVDKGCPGMWSLWGDWCPCSETCQSDPQNDPTQVRRRACVGQTLDGQCPGDELEQIEDQVCNFMKICPVPGTWTPWTVWSECSKDCDEGIKERTRECTKSYPENIPDNCEGDNREEIPCFSHTCPRSCPITKNCGCAGVPQYTTLVKELFIDFNAVQIVIDSVSKWSKEDVNQTCKRCNVPLLQTSLTKLNADIASLENRIEIVNEAKDELKRVINCHSDLYITEQYWQFFDEVHERSVYLQTILQELKSYAERFEGAISSCNEHGIFHKLMMVIGGKFN